MEISRNNITLQTTKALAQRHRRERLFGWIGAAALGFSFCFVLFLFVTILRASLPAFTAKSILLTVEFKEAAFGRENLEHADYFALIQDAFEQLFPDAEPAEYPQLLRLVSLGAQYHLEELVQAEPEVIGSRKELWVPASGYLDMLLAKEKQPADSLSVEDDRQLVRVRQLQQEGRLRTQFSWAFFTNNDSRESEMAGIAGALTGTLYTLLVTFLISFPVGLGTAIYLEEFSPKNRWIELLEINISNLAAVPPLIFGLLGLFLFINFLGMPRSSPIVAGLVFSLMTIPMIVLTSRNAIGDVPQSVRDAALGIGASRMQTLTHHVLPQAMPGIVAGTLMGLVRVLGEAAPLLMIGMVAFSIDVPQRFSDPATTLPTLIYLWASSPEQGFTAKAAAAIMVLLALLAVLNGLAVFLRRKSNVQRPVTS